MQKSTIQQSNCVIKVSAIYDIHHSFSLVFVLNVSNGFFLFTTKTMNNSGQAVDDQ